MDRLGPLIPLEHGLVLRVEPRGGLLDTQVGGLSDEAVGGYFVTRAQLNDISNDQVPNRNRLHAASLATDHRQVLIAIQTLQLNELCVLREVVVGADEDLDDEGREDDTSFKPSGGWVDDHSRDDTDDCKDGDQEQEPVIERLLDRAAPSDALRLGLIIDAVSMYTQVKVVEPRELGSVMGERDVRGVGQVRYGRSHAQQSRLEEVSWRT